MSTALENWKFELLPKDKFDVMYFSKYDTLTGTVASDKGELPALADSCYVSLEEVFFPSGDS